MKKTVLILAASVIALTSTFANAQTLGQRKAQEEQNIMFQEKVTYANKASGLNIVGEIDWTTLKAEDYVNVHRIRQDCGDVAEKVGDLAKSDKMYKDAITTGVKKIVCKRADKRSAELKDGTLTYFSGYSDDQGPYIDIKEFLGKNL